MTDLSTLRIDQPGQVLSAIGQLLSGQATNWWQVNSSSVQGDLQTLAQGAALTTSALVQGRITADTARIAFASQKRVLEETPMFVEFMAAAGAQQALDGVFNILGTAIKNVVGFNPFFIPPG
jgi:hypothetical protein